MLKALCILDTPQDRAFDLVTDMATKVFHAPIAAVSLLDQGRQWFKSSIGIDCRETPRDQAFCAHAIVSPEVMVVCDATQDDRFKDNPLVLGAPFIRFYAGAPLITPDGLALGTLCIVDTVPRALFDAAQRQMLQTLADMVMLRLESLRQRGYADVVMGIPNRDRLLEDIALREETGALSGGRVAAVAVDLCGSSYHNDMVKALGHRHADQYLILAKDRLLGMLPANTVVYRLGTTHLAFLLEQDDAALITLFEAIAALSEQPLWLQDIPHSAHTTIGSLRLGASNDAADLLRSLTAATDTAWEQGRTWCFHERSSDEEQKRAFQILSELSSALTDRPGQLSLHYQPKVDLQTGACVGVEALLRWSHPELGHVSPAEFIPLAEKTALIRRVTHWVLNAAMAQASAWQGIGLGLSMAINVSAEDLDQPAFVDELCGLLGRHGVNPHLIELEFTESALIHSPERLHAHLSRIRALGVKVSIDDFGTGHSNLTYLKNLPASTLKVDQSFVRHLSSDNADRVIVPALINLAHKLKLRVVAEGIETPEAYASLAAWGCNEGQGYWIARPMPVAQFEAWLSSSPHRTVASGANQAMI